MLSKIVTKKLHFAQASTQNLHENLKFVGKC